MWDGKDGTKVFNNYKILRREDKKGTMIFFAFKGRIQQFWQCKINWCASIVKQHPRIAKHLESPDIWVIIVFRDSTGAAFWWYLHSFFKMYFTNDFFPPKVLENNKICVVLCSMLLWYFSRCSKKGSEGDTFLRFLSITQSKKEFSGFFL